MLKNPLSKFIDYDLQKVKKVKGIDSDIAISWIYIVMLGNENNWIDFSTDTTEVQRMLIIERKKTQLHRKYVLYSQIKIIFI